MLVFKDGPYENLFTVHKLILEYTTLQSRPLVQHTGSRSTFEFPSRVKLSSPSVHCTQLCGQDQPVQQGWLGQTLCFILVEFTFTKGAEVREQNFLWFFSNSKSFIVSECKRQDSCILNELTIQNLQPKYIYLSIRLNWLV